MGIGQYVLKDEFQQFKISSSTWFSLSECQRKVHIDKFEDASLQSKLCCTSDTVLEFTDPELSVDIGTTSTLTGLPVLVVKNLWSKSYELILDGKVMKSPDAVTSRIVASFSRRKPHFVYLKDGRFECDDVCVAFSQRYNCAHTIVPAEDKNLLKQFLESYGKFPILQKENKKQPQI